MEKERSLKPDKHSLKETDYLDLFVFPLLTLALREMLVEAEKYKCFEVS
jgi:hypothetical protein